MKKSLLAVTMLTLMTSTAMAGTLEGLIDKLKSEGFSVSEVDRTMLGNYKVEARKGNLEREVVYSPMFDRVLRDRTDDKGNDKSNREVSNRSERDDSRDRAKDGNDDGVGHDVGDDNGNDGGGHDNGDDGADHEGSGHD